MSPAQPFFRQRRRVAIPVNAKHFTRCQRAALKRWLVVEKLSYAKVRALFLSRFGETISDGTLSRFWHQQCRPTPPPKTDQPSVLLDVILQSCRPIRVRVLQNSARLLFKVGRQRQLGLNKKSVFTIGPSGNQSAAS